MEYVGQMITDQQSEIVCMMEGKGDGDTVEASSIIHNSSVRDAKYLLEHFLDMAINFVSSTTCELTAYAHMYNCRYMCTEMSLLVERRLGC